MSSRPAQIEKLQRWTVENNWNRQGFRKHPGTVAFDSSKLRTLRSYDLWLVTEGRAMIESTDGAVSQVKRGSLVFIRPGYLRRLWQEKGDGRLAVIFLHFQLHDIATRAVVPLTETHDFPFLGEADDPDFAERLCMQILRVGLAVRKARKADVAARRAFADQTLKALLFQLLAPGKSSPSSRVSESNVKRHRQILGIAQRIDEAPEIFHSVAEMAQSLYLSQAYFTRLFSELVGKPPMAALIESRIRKAKQYLRGSDLTVKQIAEDLGYHESYFFCRQFKKFSGMTPLQFRTKRESRKSSDSGKSD